MHYSLHSFPTRRSSDLVEVVELEQEAFDVQGVAGGEVAWAQPRGGAGLKPDDQIASAAVEAPALFLLSADRKSTRLNSSHEWISYAVFCLKKKKKTDVL